MAQSSCAVHKTLRRVTSYARISGTVGERTSCGRETTQGLLKTSGRDPQPLSKWVCALCDALSGVRKAPKMMLYETQTARELCGTALAQNVESRRKIKAVDTVKLGRKRCLNIQRQLILSLPTGRSSPIWCASGTVASGAVQDNTCPAFHSFSSVNKIVVGSERLNLCSELDQWLSSLGWHGEVFWPCLVHLCKFREKGRRECPI